MAGIDAPTPAGGGGGPSGNASRMTRGEAADYIASLLDGLRLVAQNAELTFLAYLISVALEEAKTTDNERRQSV